MKRVGFIGLGNMGASMAKNLLSRTKNSVMVYDLNKDMMRKYFLAYSVYLLFDIEHQLSEGIPDTAILEVRASELRAGPD